MNTPAKLIALVATFGTIALAPAQQSSTAKPNLLTNPSFEDGQNGWQFSAHRKQGTVAVDTTEKRNGKSGIRLENTTVDDSFMKQEVTVKPKTRYRFTGYIKTKDVLVKGTGATLSLGGGFEHTESMTGKQGWKKVSFEFDSGPLSTVTVGPRLGHHASLATGVAWFDDLELVEIGPSRKR